MSDTIKFSQLTDATSVNLSTIVPVVQDGENYTASLSTIRDGLDVSVDFNNIDPIAVGDENTSSGANSSTFGYNNTASGAKSSAFGYKVTTTVTNTQELGYWADPTTRAGSIRIHGTGMVSSTIQNRATEYGDGGATAGSEADDTLIREGYAIRRNGDDIHLDVNIGGTVKTISLGTAV